jgi:hypothetical protein
MGQSKENKAYMSNTAAVSIYGVGRGRIISFSQNPNFRAFWYGTNRLFINGLMFGQMIYSPRY